MTTPIEPLTRDQLERGLALVRERLLIEAQARDWCEEYDIFVRTVNSEAGWDVLEECAKPQEVTVAVTFVAPPEWSPEGLNRSLMRAIQEHAGEYELHSLEVDVQSDAE